MELRQPCLLYGFRKESRATLKEICHRSPEAYTAKILQQLAKSGIIESQKGLHGGFILKMKEGWCGV